MKSARFLTALIGLLALAACVPSYQAPQPYYETRLGFNFLIPSNWPTGRYGEHEYAAVELAQTQPLSSGAIELYYIPTDNTKPVQSLFRIYQYTRANWATTQATPGLDRPQLVVIGQYILDWEPPSFSLARYSIGANPPRAMCGLRVL